MFNILGAGKPVTLFRHKEAKYSKELWFLFKFFHTPALFFFVILSKAPVSLTEINPGIGMAG